MSNLEEPKKDIKIRFLYEKSPDYKYYYVNGARGGNIGLYDIKLSFFTDHLVQSKEDIIKEGKIKPDKISHQFKEDLVIQRIENFEITLSRLAAIELKNFLEILLKPDEIKESVKNE